MSNQFICYIVVGGLAVASLAVGIVGAIQDKKKSEREKARKKFNNIYSDANANPHINLI